MSRTVAGAFLRRLFSQVPTGYRVHVSAIPGGQSWFDPKQDADDALPSDEMLADSNVYFGLAPRGPREIIDKMVFVPLDVDHGVQGTLAPRPSFRIKSGRDKGLHAYWLTDGPIEVEYGIKLAKLAAMAYGGDKAICNPKHLMRVPGSRNQKYKHQPTCEVEDQVDLTYDGNALEETFVGVIASQYWEEGQRHEMALAIGAILSRADWPPERIESAVRTACRVSGDTELRDRVTAAAGTATRRAAGMAVSAGFLHEAMGDKYKELIAALGITARDGEVLLDGVKIATTHNVERDLADFIDATGDWGFADGRVVHWVGKMWKPVSDAELMSGVFNVLARLTIIEAGDELEYQATARLATNVAKILTGRFQASPMEDMHEDLTPLENGVLNTRTLELSAHSKENRNRWVLPIPYDKNATCPLWERFLREMAGDTYHFIQEWMGYCLISGNPWQLMLWIFGPSGTGKSTCIQMFADLFGDSCIAIVPDRLNDYTLASLSGKRIAMCSEMSSSMLKTPVLKSLVTGDAVQARLPYGQPFSMAFQGKIVWGSNTLPQVDQGEGFWRRLLVAHFNILPQVNDRFLKEKLRNELPGVLNWALEGLRRVRQFGEDGEWPLPASMRAMVDEYQRSSDLFTLFVEDELARGDDLHFNVVDMYQRYCLWCDSRGNKAEKFGPPIWLALKSQGFKELPTTRDTQGKAVRMWAGGELISRSGFGAVADTTGLGIEDETTVGEA